jgi:hypothetical protein
MHLFICHLLFVYLLYVVENDFFFFFVIIIIYINLIFFFKYRKKNIKKKEIHVIDYFGVSLTKNSKGSIFVSINIILI